METLRRKLSYANVMATIAVFLALGGAAYAIKLGRNSVGSRQLKPGAVKLKDTANQLRLKCPAGTSFYQGACIERSIRSPAQVEWPDAEFACRAARRRLPSVSELEGFRHEPGITLSSFREWTSEVSLEGGAVVTVIWEGGNFGPQDAELAVHSFRCVAEPRR